MGETREELTQRGGEGGILGFKDFGFGLSFVFWFGVLVSVSSFRFERLFSFFCFGLGSIVFFRISCFGFSFELHVLSVPHCTAVCRTAAHILVYTLQYCCILLLLLGTLYTMPH